MTGLFAYFHAFFGKDEPEPNEQIPASKVNPVLETKHVKNSSSATTDDNHFLDMMSDQLGKIEGNAKIQNGILMQQAQRLAPLANRIDDAQMKTKDLTKKVNKLI